MSALFRTISTDEIPQEWRREPPQQEIDDIAKSKGLGSNMQRFVAVAVPDYELFWRYQAWLETQTSHGLVSICITSREHFRREYGEMLERSTLSSLIHEGRPS